MTEKQSYEQLKKQIIKNFLILYFIDPVYILMEYVKGGNLQSYLRKCRPSQLSTTSEEMIPPSAKDLKMIALQIARGMSHVHTCGVSYLCIQIARGMSHVHTCGVSYLCIVKPGLK